MVETETLGTSSNAEPGRREAFRESEADSEGIESTSELPVACSRMMREAGLRGNFLNEWHLGDYLIWHNHPQIKVVEDGRTAPFPPDLSRRLIRIFHQGDADALRSLEALELSPRATSGAK